MIQDIERKNKKTDEKPAEKLNDLDPKKWREYEKQGLQFMSVWDTPERDPLGWTQRTIHGNCPVEIPRQCVWRFSKQGETVLDPFVGGGTTLVACARLKRKGIGIEINPNVAKVVKENLSAKTLDSEINAWLGEQRLIVGDSRDLKSLGIGDESVDLVFAHPPYWSLINYSEEHGFVAGDLSTLSTLEEFLDSIRMHFAEVNRVLRSGRYFCVLIGEAFLKGGKVVPLDYHLTKLALDLGFKFFTKVIKYTRLATSRMNFINTMKYRSLRSNFFICIHDYVLIFRKPRGYRE